MTKDLNRHFSKEGIQVSNQHMEKCSTALIIREIHVKTKMRYYHLEPIKITIIKTTKDRIFFSLGFNKQGKRWICLSIHGLSIFTENWNIQFDYSASFQKLPWKSCFPTLSFDSWGKKLLLPLPKSISLLPFLFNSLVSHQ